EGGAEAVGRQGTSVSTVVPWSVGQVKVVVGDKNWPTSAMGTTTGYWSVRDFHFAKGQSWSETDELLKTKVCVIGDAVKDALFGNQDPIGQYVRVGRHAYR